jgi:acetyl-CoA C-acetyltransferase
MAAGVPQEKTAWGLNQLCGSGLRTVAIGMQQIANGDADIIVAGGQESMSQAPHAAYMRSGTKMGDFKLVDTMLKDGLLDAFNGYHVFHRPEKLRGDPEGSVSPTKTKIDPKRTFAPNNARASIVERSQ